MLDYLKYTFRYTPQNELIANLRHNFFLPLSSFFFLLLYARVDISYYLGIPIAVIGAIIFSMTTTSVVDKIMASSNLLKVYSLINSIGICFCSWRILRYSPFLWGESSFTLRLLFMFASIPTAYVISFFLMSYITSSVKIIIGSQRINSCEIFIYSLLLLFALIFSGICYLKSEAFYSTTNPADIIYTSDSPILVRYNAYIMHNYIENDIKQPLFAVFACPFMGITSLLAEYLTDTFKYLIMDYTQILLLLMTNIILAYSLKINHIQRICFVTVFSFTYTYLISSIAMEQYVVCYFWLILTVCLINNNSIYSKTALYGAGGTLLTSLALTPLTFSSKESKSIKPLFSYTLNTLLGYFLLVLFLGRFDVITKALDSFNTLRKFSGESVSIIDRINQYSHFLINMFIAPEAGPSFDKWPSWQLYPVTSFSFPGLIALILAIICLVVTRKKKLSQLAGIWIIFSIFILVVIGWGTAENGLILYSLYFVWAFMVLYFSLLLSIENKLSTKVIIPISSLLCCIIMIYLNSQSFIELITFISDAYPA